MSDARWDRLFNLGLIVALIGVVGLALRPASALAQTVSWPPSTGILVSEVVTGGASASDEFVELYNASASALDLGGLELVYVTASGSTVTRKQTWTQQIVPAHHHLLIANASGVWAGGADGTYTGGFAASGGSIALRTLGGVVVDAISWGDASNAFVEGAPGPAPASGSSLERRPGGSLGNAMDANDNMADLRIEASPVAHNLAASPVPAVTPTPTATVVPTPTPTPTPAPTAGPMCATLPAATPSPTPAETATPGPSGQQTIGQARSALAGTLVSTVGRLATPAGLIDEGRGAFIEDDLAGIALHLGAGDWPSVAMGDLLVVTGTVEVRAGQTTLVIADPSSIAVIEPGTLLGPIDVPTGFACEPFEGRSIAVEGLVTAAAVTTPEGIATWIDDGTGALAVLAAPPAGVATGDLAVGSRLRLSGVLGQLDLIGDGVSGYRLLIRGADDIVVLEPAPTSSPTPTAIPTPTASPTPTPTSAPTASPTPTPTASPTQAPTPSPTPTPSAAPTLSPSPSPTPTPEPTSVLLSIGDARGQPIGAEVRVRGVVTALPGALLGSETVAIQDQTGGIFVQLPDATLDGVVLGRVLEATGTLAAPYGNLEIRSRDGGIALLEQSSQPTPLNIGVGEMDDDTEGLLARLSVTIERIETSSTGSLTLIVSDASGEGRVFFHAPLGVDGSDFSADQRLAVVGLVGDRLGLFRLWPRSMSDVAVIADPPTPTPRPTASATPRPTPSPTARPTARPSTTPRVSPRPSASPTSNAAVISIADALRRQGQTVAVEGIVTVKLGLLDSDATRTILQDSSAAIMVRLPADVTAHVGQRITATGQVGTYYGAPSLTASSARSTGQGTINATTVRAAPIAAALEWRLVAVSGRVEDVRRDGETWRAEVAVSGGTIPISGLQRSGIASTALEEGRNVAITGIVKRAYPTATDQRLSVVPRSAADIKLGPAVSGSSQPSLSPRPGTSGSPIGSGRPVTARPSSAGGPVGPVGSASPGINVVQSLDDLEGHEDEVVTVGGVVTAIDGTAVLIDDGSASVRLQLTGDAAALASRFVLGDLLNATGRVATDASGQLEVVVDDPGAVERLARLTAGATATGEATESSGSMLPPVGELPSKTGAQPATATAELTALALFGASIVLIVGVLAADPHRRAAWRKRLDLVVGELRERARSLVAARQRG